MTFFHLGDIQKAEVFGVANRRILRRQAFPTACSQACSTASQLCNTLGVGGGTL